MRSMLRWLSILTMIGMFIVLLDGALVTKTDSGRGCGDDWPLCNGKFVPAYTVESMIEYSHRAVSGLVGILVLASTIAAWKEAKRRRAPKESVVYACIALFFTFVQALLGAAAVMWPQSPPVMALHYGFSLLAFSGTLLLVLSLRKGNAPDERERSSKSRTTAAVSPGFQLYVWFLAVYAYIVVYIGAFVRHTESAGGCLGWPLCNGQVVPELSGATGIAFVHRVAALLLFLAIAWLTYRAARDYITTPGIYRMSVSTLILVLLQILSGAFVVNAMGTDWFLLASLLHTTLVAGLFGVLCYLSILVYRLGTKR